VFLTSPRSRASHVDLHFPFFTPIQSISEEVRNPAAFLGRSGSFLPRLSARSPLGRLPYRFSSLALANPLSLAVPRSLDNVLFPLNRDPC